MGGANFRQKNLLKDLIYLGHTKPINKQTIKGLFKFAVEPILETQAPKAVVMIRLFDTKELDGVLKRLEYTNTEVYSFDDVTNGENLAKEEIWGDTEFLVLLSPRYSVCLLWDYSTEQGRQTSSVYQLLNSRDVNDVVKIISQNSKIDLMRYTQEYTPERRSNELLNKAVCKFIDFADSFVEEAAMNQAQVGVMNGNDDIVKKYEYISSKSRLISHDIKNHLSIIDLYSKILEKRLNNISTEDSIESLSNAVNSIKKSKDAISVLLSEIRTIQGVNLTTLNFSNLLQNAIDLVQAKAESNSVKISVSNLYDGEIIADENKLLNVLINLFYNALDALNNKDNTRIINVSTTITDDNMLKISVKDNGCGIAAENQNKIFDEGYTSKSSGSGLGLYISKEAMKEQYGDLILVNSDQNGTTFDVIVPKL